MSQIGTCLRKTSHGYAHLCPGCGRMHVVYTAAVRPGAPTWVFNGDAENPTFSPSVLHTWGREVDPSFVDEGPGDSGRCHYFIRNGQIEFCGDSTHELAGKTVPLPSVVARNA